MYFTVKTSVTYLLYIYFDHVDVFKSIKGINRKVNGSKTEETEAKVTSAVQTFYGQQKPEEQMVKKTSSQKQLCYSYHICHKIQTLQMIFTN